MCPQLLNVGSLFPVSHLAVINVSNSTNVDMRLVALEDGGVASRRLLDELLLTPAVDGALKGRRGGCAEGARGAQEGASE